MHRVEKQRRQLNWNGLQMCSVKTIATRQLLIRVLLKFCYLLHRWEYILVAMYLLKPALAESYHKFTLQICLILHWQLCSCSQCLLSGIMGDGGPSDVQGSPPNLINKQTAPSLRKTYSPPQRVQTLPHFPRGNETAILKKQILFFRIFQWLCLSNNFMWRIVHVMSHISDVTLQRSAMRHVLLQSLLKSYIAW